MIRFWTGLRLKLTLFTGEKVKMVDLVVFLPGVQTYVTKFKNETKN